MSGNRFVFYGGSYCAHWCAVGVFFAVLIFQFSLVVSFIIAVVLLMVDIEVYGFLYIIGAKLNCKHQIMSSTLNGDFS